MMRRPLKEKERERESRTTENPSSSTRGVNPAPSRPPKKKNPKRRNKREATADEGGGGGRPVSREDVDAVSVDNEDVWR